MAVINVLSKADQVLRAIDAQGEMTIQDLVKQIDEPRSSLYRLMESLQELGWVAPGATKGSFRIGMKLFQIGSQSLVGLDVRQLALPVMEQLRDDTGHSVFLCVRDGYEGVCIERLDGRSVQTFELRLGRALPLHAGGAARALLAFNPSLWDEYIDTVHLKTYTENTLDTPAKLRPVLEREHAEGVVVSVEDVTPGIAAIGAPIYNHAGALVAALSMSGISSVLLGSKRRANSIRAVRDAAAQISARLGYEQENTNGIPLTNRT